ncbi:hypothetical protein FW774_07495 [Pedobacter sp. BS3]|uniref:glycosyl hydrolase n=1 Tax=Pedobacter sp. BS3 TaxID=2567937 RepID=UPI0011EEEB1D|nr:glycosyl hydrolase [Pedobacter sp. BS3]TZF84814.1 hypothetical protein FW774_07495 [Pedobacter sp. BS3]
MRQVRFLTQCIFLSLIIAVAACGKKSSPGETQPPPTKPEDPPVADGGANSNLGNIAVTVDCNQSQGTLYRFEQANTTSTTSPLPGTKAQTLLQGLHHKVVRVWIQLRYVYNKGYNYKYDGSGVAVEDALSFYSSVSDSLLVCMSAYNGTASSPMPAAGTAYQNFVKNTVVYYKTKFPKIKYIQVGNEPDYNGDAIDTYYTVYKDYYKGIAAANAALNLTGNNRILVSNGPFTSTTTFSAMLPYTSQFLARYAADTDPDKHLDFFCFHCYTENDNPKSIANDKTQIENLMTSYGVPKVPIFVTELGIYGGSYIPSAWTEADAVTAQPAGQFAKLYNLYDSGISRVFNWAVYHGDIKRKSEFADLTNAYTYPYGNALICSSELSVRGNRIQATLTRALDSKGLGINAMAAIGNNKGIAVLVWNYNFTNAVADQSGNIMIKNIPQSMFTGKIRRTVYLIDSKNNNYFNNSTQKNLTALSDEAFDYSASVGVPLTLERNSVALVTLTPQ